VPVASNVTFCPTKTVADGGSTVNVARVRSPPATSSGVQKMAAASASNGLSPGDS
jgi:hypothetical protein